MEYSHHILIIVTEKTSDFSVTMTVFGYKVPFGAIFDNRPTKTARFFCDDCVDMFTLMTVSGTASLQLWSTFPARS